MHPYPNSCVRVRPRATCITLAAELRQHVLGIELEELLLPAADLLDVELVEAGVLVFADLLEVRLEVGAARNRFGDHLLRDELRGLLEVPGRRQDLRELAAERVARPQPARGLARALLVLVPAALHRTGDEQVLAAGFAAELLDGVLLG